MKLRFGQIEEVLQVANDIPVHARPQFRARLRNLFRVGLSLPSGKVGRRANFHPADLFKMAFAVELLQAGLPPEKAAQTVGQYWPAAAKGIFACRGEWKGGAAKGRFLVAEPRALTAPVFSFRSETLATLAARLKEGRRLIVIDLAGMFSRTISAAAQASIDMDALNQSLDADQEIVLRDGPRVFVGNVGKGGE